MSELATSENSQPRSRLSITGLILCAVAVALLFVPTAGPILAFFCAGAGFWLCVPRAIQNRRNKIRKDNLTNFGFVVCLIIAVVAFVMAINSVGDLDSEPEFISKPSECHKLENIMRTGTQNGLSHSDIEGHWRRTFGSQSEVDRIKDLCNDYYRQKYND